MAMSAAPDLLDVRRAARELFASKLKDGWLPAGLYTYRLADESDLFHKIRFDPPHGSADEKFIRPIHFDGNRWRIGEPPKPSRGRPLYLLPELLAADASCVVYVVEGEKAAHALAKTGVVITTSGAATSAGSADWTPMRGRPVRIWPDNDPPGAAYGADVATRLRSLGCAVEILDTASLGLPSKADAWDWIEQHASATAADLDALPWKSWTPLEPAQAGAAAALRLIRADELTPQPIDWLWCGWLARGKLHVLAGAPGTGKTTIALAFAATASCGGRWPDSTPCEAGNVLIWSGEDDPGDTLLPRLTAMGADRTRVYFVGDVSADGERRAFDPARDIAALESEAQRIGGVTLLIVDPIVSAIAGDSHKNAEVRRDLQPLVDLGGQLHCAVLGISHFTKGTAGRDPVERVTGSLAFGALARLVFGAAKVTSADGKAQRIFARAKSNIGPDGGGWVYEIRQDELEGHPGLFASQVIWGEALEGTARELLASVEDMGGDGAAEAMSERDLAIKWLADLLADGPVPKTKVDAEAKAAGHKLATVRRAKTALKVRAVKAGMKEGWNWELPEGAQRNPKALTQNVWTPSAPSEDCPSAEAAGSVP